MLIGNRIRAIREAKNLSQGNIEKRSGLLRSYLSRVEHDHTVPAAKTLEKLARALEVPLYQLFYEGEEPRAHGAMRTWAFSSFRIFSTVRRFTRLETAQPL